MPLAQFLFVEDLRRLSCVLHDMSESLWTAGDWIRGDVGDPAVDTAIGHFLAHWADGRVQAQENCIALSAIAGRSVPR